MAKYSHPEHGDMEFIETYRGYDDEIEVWRCVDCHVVAQPEDADEVFDAHDCGQYESVRKGISDNL